MSEIPVQLVAGASTTYDAVRMKGDEVTWIEGRPDDGNFLVGWRASDGVRALATGVGSAVHEYGGGEYVTAGTVVWFSAAQDGRIYRIASDGRSAALTPLPDVPGAVRYADLHLSPDSRWLVCVRERHEPMGVVNDLVRLATNGDSEVEVLASGEDFYSFPRFRPDGRWIAWTSWPARVMPWQAAWLHVAQIDDDGRLGPPIHVAGGPDESVFQPEWSPNGTLHFVSDRNGWWNIYAWRGGKTTPVLLCDAELGAAQWEFGYSTYTILGENRIVVVAQRGGAHCLQVAEHGVAREVDVPFTSIKPYLSGRGSRVALIASTPVQTPAVTLVDVDTGEIRRLAGGATPRQAQTVSRPEPFSVEGTDGPIHGLFYSPTGSSREPSPLIVKAHPGPESNAPQRLDWHTQYFTSRGFAVVDVDYRGSTGYGRAYRQALYGKWGERDALDCARMAEHLASNGKVEPQRIAIWGASAGGYTALRALIVSDVFATAIARSPIVDPLTWRKTAPKFQAMHADTLIGPWPEAAHTYTERSVLHNAYAITRPVLILHGEDDKVAPVAESRALAEALGDRAQLITFPNEGHVLCSRCAVERATEAELAFLSDALRLV